MALCQDLSHILAMGLLQCLQAEACKQVASASEDGPKSEGLTLLTHWETSLNTPWFSPKSYSTLLHVVCHMLPVVLSAG